MGRDLIGVFMEKPSKKTYPDYYKIIQNPIDMITIEQNIKDGKYGRIDDIVEDFKLMFNNCREYNEEGSVIYEDANRLEAALTAKVEELKEELTPKQKMMKRIFGAKKELTEKLTSLFDAIRDYKGKLSYLRPTSQNS
jgi:protein polybromo-1